MPLYFVDHTTIYLLHKSVTHKLTMHIYLKAKTIVNIYSIAKLVTTKHNDQTK